MVADVPEEGRAEPCGPTGSGPLDGGAPDALAELAEAPEVPRREGSMEVLIAADWLRVTMEESMRKFGLNDERPNGAGWRKR